MSAPSRARPESGLKFRPPDRRKKSVQIIYGHLPPVSVLIREQRLRNATYLEQRAEQTWFAGNGQAGRWPDWRRIERNMVLRLCRALLRRDLHKLQPLSLH